MGSRFLRVFFLCILVGGCFFGAQPANGQTATPAAAPAFPRELSRATYTTPNDDVRTVQQRLLDLGYTPLSATGLYGAQTEAAVRAFQTASGQAETGIVNEQTWNALFANPPADPTPADPAPVATPSPTATANVPVAQVVQPTANTDRISLSLLGVREESLDGPFDARSISIRLPASWRLQAGAALELDFSTFLGATGNDSTDETGASLGGSFDVQFNNVSLGRFFLDRSGSQQVTLPISTSALIPTRADGSHTLSFSLDAGLICGMNRQTSVVVRSATTLVLPHTLGATTPTLAALPRPIYQNSPLQADVAALIVPDQPTASELQAALTVAAEFGDLSDNKLALPLIPEGVLTPTLRSEANLIFVGRAASFQTLDEIDFPAARDGDSFRDSDAQPGDGVIQIAVSPWSDIHTVLLVSGIDDAAVIKASQALSTGTVRPTLNPALSVIADVRPPLAITTTAELQTSSNVTDGLLIERTLANLGYETQTEFGIGGKTFNFDVELPYGYDVGTDSFIDLVFAHSAILNYDVSAMLVRLNDQPLSSVRFSDETASAGRARVTIPRNILKGGKNRLTVTANLIPNSPCVNPTLAGIWISIRPETVLRFSLRPSTTRTVVIRSLDGYFESYITSPTLQNVAFVLPTDDVQSWNTAARIAADLGNRVDGNVVELRAVFADNLDAVKQTHDLIVVGQPAAIPFIAELNRTFPAPFEAGNNHPTLGNSRVTYRIPAALSLGYLEIARSPWNADKTVLGVLGSSTEAIKWSGNALLVSRLRSQLNGIVAVVNNEQLSVEDSVLTQDTSTLAENALPPDQTTVEYRPLPEVERPTWILGAIAAAMAVMLAILLFVGSRAWRNRRQV